MKIGKSKYGGQQKKYWKLKDGEATFRILPPLGDLADEGRWSVFYSIHYGYKNPAGKARPFQSCLVKNRKGMAEVGDPALDRINMLKGKLEAAKAAGDKKTLDVLLQLVGGQKSIYNLDSNHYVNAIDEQGNIGVLKLRHRAKLALDAEIKDLRDKGTDPLSVNNGRFFTFRRTGNALDTSFKVSVKKETFTANVGGQNITGEKDLVHVLNEEIIGRLSDEAAELGKLFKQLAPETVEQIVKSSDLKTGIVAGIDDILGYGKQTASGQVEEGFDDSGDGFEAPAAAPVVQATTAPVQAPVAVTTPTPAPVAAAPAPAPIKIAPAVVTQATAAPQVDAVSEMTEDAFLASLGLDS